MTTTDAARGHTPATGIIGLGTVGEALLRLLLDTGHQVIAVDPDPEVLARVGWRLGETPRPDGSSVTLTTQAAALSAAEVVIEAAPEDMDAKTWALRLAHAHCPESTVLLTTASSLPVPRLVIASGRPARCLGLRLFAPPTAGAPAEAVPTAMTSDDSIAAADALVTRLGLKPVLVGARAAADATALVHRYLDRAAALYEQGHATRDAIDTAMRLGCGLPAGPLEMLDRMGRPVPATGNADSSAADSDEDAIARTVNRVGVLGSGAMARGIAEVTAVAGFPTVLVARSRAKADQALEAIGASLDRAVRKGKVTAEARKETFALLEGVDEVSALSDCDLVIEAVVEDTAVKRELFAELGELCKPGALLATTTSSLSVAECTAPSGRAAETIGLHFFNPAPVMRLVELVRTGETTDDTVATAREFCARLRKTTVDCPDRAGFIVNHLLFPYLGDAIRLLDRHDVTIEEIDAAVRQGYGFPMGPFALLDTIGLDVSLAIMRRLHEQFPIPDFAPPRALEELVATGALGRKNGRGFQIAPRA